MAKYCVQCVEDSGKPLSPTTITAPVVGEIAGEGYCQFHYNALEGGAKATGLLPGGVQNHTEMLLDLVLGTIADVRAKKLQPDVATAISALSDSAVKIAELEWKMRRSKDISYVVKQLEREPR